MDAQEEHDYLMSQRMKDGKSILEKGSRERLEGLLAKKDASLPDRRMRSEEGPIEWALKNYPSLTRETAERMAEEFGF